MKLRLARLLSGILLTANFLLSGLALANERLSGTWYDPTRPGDGFDFHVVSAETGGPAVVIFYYGYDLNGKRLWLVSDTLATADGSDFQNLTMFSADGNGFQGAGSVSLTPWGDLDFKSTGCGSGRFTLTPSNQQPKIINASQLIDVAGPGCLQDSPRAYETIGGLSGSWFVPSDSGDGFNIWTANSGLVLFFYGYDQNGDHLWLVSNPYYGPIIPGKEIQVDVVTGTGGSFYDVRPATLKNWGKVQILWKDCDSAEARLEGLDGTRLMNLSRLVGNPGTLCEGPGTITLSEPTVTFEGAGESRDIQFEVRDYAGTSSSTALVELDVEDKTAAEIVSATDGTAAIRAKVDSITSTKVTFWDPVTNSTQELPISIVDLQPGVVWIPYDWVQSWQTPLDGQVTEIRLDASSVTNDLTVGTIIASEGGLVGRVESVVTENGAVIVQVSFVALPDVFWNLDFGVTLSASAIEVSSASAVTQNGLEESGHRKFSIPKSRTEALDLSCKFDSGTVINNALELFAEPPTLQVGLASTKLDSAIVIKNARTIRESSRVFVESLLLGEVSLKFAPNAANPQFGIKCTFAKEEFFPTWARIDTSLGSFVPKFSLGPGVDFFLESIPEGRLTFDLGLKLRWGIDFKNGVESSITGGLEAGDHIALKGIQQAAPGSSIEIKPLLKGKLGIAWGSPIPIPPYFYDVATLGLVESSLSFPFSWLWTPPFDSASPDYKGQYFSISAAASGEVQASIDNFLTDFLNISPLNISPGTELFSWEKVLSESPRVSITPIDCGAKCGVGDIRKFRLDILKDGFYRNRISGEAHLMAFNNGSTVISPDRYQAGNFSLTDQLEMWPTAPGEWTIAPRFSSADDGLLYGGDPVVITVTGEAPTFQLTVNKSGSGTITSSPAGINCGSMCGANFMQGTVITLTASPGSGWIFSGWSGACSGASTNCTVTLTGALSVGAVFSQNSQGSGSGILNDTGIDWGGNYPIGNNGICLGETISAQDCSHGRDATQNDDSNGHAGFSFTKLDVNGNDLPASATEWSCVRDEVTGLTWEVKSGTTGLRYRHNTYTWYSPDPSTNGGSRGTANGGSCTGSACDTHNFVQAVNSSVQALCGARDWRIPSREELRSIVDYGIGKDGNAIDMNYFPYGLLNVTWCNTPYAGDPNKAWAFYRDGDDRSYNRDDDFGVRLVRGQ